MKVYGIVYRGEKPRDELIRAARQIAETRLEASGAITNHYGVGFVGIHEGRGGNFVFMDWWADENELHHHVYISSSDAPEALEYVTPSGLTACVWDLRLLCFEREAWLTSVLKKHTAPDLEGYLATTLNADA